MAFVGNARARRGIRTRTVRLLKPSPLPIGLDERTPTGMVTYACPSALMAAFRSLALGVEPFALGESNPTAIADWRRRCIVADAWHRHDDDRDHDGSRTRLVLLDRQVFKP